MLEIGGWNFLLWWKEHASSHDRQPEHKTVSNVSFSIAFWLAISYLPGQSFDPS
jgi:hypothetical protein